jgi:hypothetical protein
MTCAKVKTGVSFNQSLYIMHKEVLLAKETLQVTRMKDDIVPLLDSFLDPLGKDREEVLSAVNASMKESDVELKDNPGEACFAIMADQEVIGVVVLSRKVLATQDLDWLRANYELDTFVNYERHRMRSQAMVTQWILNPAFSRWAKFIIREILRRYEKTLLYFHGPKDVAPASEIIDEFLPIRPRRRMQKTSGEPDDVFSSARPSSAVATAESPLFLATKKHLSQPKITIGSRIVVVAGSPYAYSALETLCFVPHLNFANLYVVMERPPVPFLSIEAEAANKGDDSDSGKTKFGDGLSGCLSVRDVDDPLERDLYALGMSYRSTLVRGHLTDIDRGNRAIVVSDEVVVEYDVLIISSPSQGTEC